MEYKILQNTNKKVLLLIQDTNSWLTFILQPTIIPAFPKRSEWRNGELRCLHCLINKEKSHANATFVLLSLYERANHVQFITRFLFMTVSYQWEGHKEKCKHRKNSYMQLKVYHSLVWHTNIHKYGVRCLKYPCFLSNTSWFSTEELCFAEAWA